MLKEKEDIERLTGLNIYFYTLDDLLNDASFEWAMRQFGDSVDGFNWEYANDTPVEELPDVITGNTGKAVYKLELRFEVEDLGGSFHPRRSIVGVVKAIQRETDERGNERRGQ